MRSGACGHPARAALCRHRTTGLPRRAMVGLSLIELMIALVLGLLVMLAAIGLFAGNRAVYGNTESLARIQENARAGFEMMARDIREADGAVCRSPAYLGAKFSPTDDPDAARGKLPLFSGFDPPYGKPWGHLGYWGDGLHGGDDSIELRSASADALPVSSVEDVIVYFKGVPRFVWGDGVLVCDGNVGYVFMASSVGPGYVVAPGPGGACSDCGASSSGFDLKPGLRSTYVAPVSAVRWSVKPNGRGGRSLYRERPSHAGVTTEVDEVIEDVRSLTLTYLLPGATRYVRAAAVGTAWKKVRAVRIELELQANKTATGDGIKRRIVHVVSLRNRNP